jgi:hypothetical protein
MNWRVGLLRIWVVGTAIWIGLVVTLSWIDYQSGLWSITVDGVLYWAQNVLPDRWGVIFLPPLAVLAVGAALLWALRGFRVR